MADAIRVLVADDVDDYRMLLRMQLELDGRFEVVGEAANGLEAVEMVGAERPDVIVLDVAMPEMDGLAAAKEIRAATPDTRIVIVSGFGRDVGEARALAGGADLYVEKGGPTSNLLEAMVNLVNERIAGKHHSIE